MWIVSIVWKGIIYQIYAISEIMVYLLKTIFGFSNKTTRVLTPI